MSARYEVRDGIAVITLDNPPVNGLGHATRTDAACDAIRGWLEFCLDAYCVVSSERPEWFAHGGS